MARTALTAQQIDLVGLNPVLSAANVAGHSVANDPRTYVEVKNSDTLSMTVSIPTPMTVNGLAVTDRTVTIPSGQTRKIGIRGAPEYLQADGTIYIDFSSVTSVTVGLFRN